MGRGRSAIVALLTLGLTLAPTAFAHASDGALPPALSAGSGVLMLVAAAVLLREMLALKAVARGAAIAENVSYVVLAVLCLAASVLLGWVARYIPWDFSAEHTRLGADLLSTVATVLFIIYFGRVRRVMRRYLEYVDGEKQLLASVLDEEEQVH